MIVVACSLVTSAVALVALLLIAKHVFTKKELTEAYKYAVWGVSAAEETFAAGNGDTKFEYVRDLLLKRFNLSDEDARMFVNAAVQGLRNAGIKPPAVKGNNVSPITQDAA